MENLMSTFSDRQGDLVQLLLEHVQISMIALFVAILLAVPFAIFVVKYKKASEVNLQLAGILQTIPSLALLGLFIPFLGIGKVPAIVALVIYGLFPILQNTITGLQGIDPLLQEAAEAFGMSRIEKLKKFELVLAMPSIIGGIRTSSVMLIGTATLGALIGAGGLGTFILLGGAHPHRGHYGGLIGCRRQRPHQVLGKTLVKSHRPVLRDGLGPPGLIDGQHRRPVREYPHRCWKIGVGTGNFNQHVQRPD